MSCPEVTKVQLCFNEQTSSLTYACADEKRTIDVSHEFLASGCVRLLGTAKKSHAGQHGQLPHGCGERALMPLACHGYPASRGARARWRTFYAQRGDLGQHRRSRASHDRVGTNVQIRIQEAFVSRTRDDFVHKHGDCRKVWSIKTAFTGLLC